MNLFILHISKDRVINWGISNCVRNQKIGQIKALAIFSNTMDKKVD